MKANLPIEMISRSVETGPSASTFSIRGGALAYAPFDAAKTPDGKIFDTDGTTILSPIDEFNAPYEWRGHVLQFDDADKRTRYEVQLGERQRAQK